MKFIKKLSVVPIFFLPLISGWAGTQQEAKLIEQPTAKTTDPWKITVGVPAWLAGVSGDIGAHGFTNHVDVGAGQILTNANIVTSGEVEIRKGRFGILGGFLYINAQDSGQQKGLVAKVDIGLQQYISQLAASYRIIDKPQGWLELLAGFRFFYIGSQTGLQANEQNIDQASTRLVNQFATQLATPNSDVRNLIAKNLDLSGLNDRNPSLPVPPLAGGRAGEIRELVRQALERRRPELVEAILSGVQARIDQVKTELTNEVAGKLTTALNRDFSLYEHWFDPFIGLRGRYNLNKAFYLTAEGDVGGFGIGSEITWQVYGALGCQLTHNIYSELGYRYLYLDYDTTSFVYQVSMHGAQVTVGMNF